MLDEGVDGVEVEPVRVGHLQDLVRGVIAKVCALNQSRIVRISTS